MNKVKYAMLNAGTVLLENQNTCKSNQVETMKEALRIISGVLNDTEKEASEKKLEELNRYLKFFIQDKNFDAAKDIQKEIEQIEAVLIKLKETV